MTEEYNKFLKQSLDLKSAREERHRDVSRDKLFKAAKKKIYEEARAQILDRGNTQIRNLDSEFVNYEIVRKKHYISLPVQTGEEKHDG